MARFARGLVNTAADQIEVLREALDTVARIHHGLHTGRFDDCDRDTCRRSRRALAVAALDLAPEVPPRRDGLREALDAVGASLDKAFGSRASVWGWDTIERLVATPEPPDSGDGAAPVSLDDPAILPIQVRIHRAKGDDWPVERCGGCFDLAYQYVKTSRLIRAPLPPPRERPSD